MTRAALVAAAASVLMASTAMAQPAMTEPMPEGNEVSDIQQVGGTLTAFLFGFGLGHAVEGRWDDEGWKYTLVDSVGMAGFIGGAVTALSCDHNCTVPATIFYGGMLAIMVSRYAQIYDTAWGARKHNDRLYARRKRAGMRYSATPILAPTSAADGVVAGAALSF